MTKYTFISLFIFLLFLPPCYAVETYRLPEPGNDIIGYVKTVYAKPGDTVLSIAQRYRIGINELLEANRHIRAKSILQPWTQILLPTSYILPEGPREGVVINISEMRLYYYPQNENLVITAPISVGREGWDTPLMQTTVYEKKAFPDWRPPESIREFTRSHGIILPEIVPAGPQNPLGDYALRLGATTYMIHGTNEPQTIGLRITSGCIRMYPHDIAELYYTIPVGTHVRIINQPYKMGWYNGQLFLESHKPIPSLEPTIGLDSEQYISSFLEVAQLKNFNHSLINKLLNQFRGYPQAVF